MLERICNVKVVVVDLFSLFLWFLPFLEYALFMALPYALPVQNIDALLMGIVVCSMILNLALAVYVLSRRNLLLKLQIGLSLLYIGLNLLFLIFVLMTPGLLFDYWAPDFI